MVFFLGPYFVSGHMCGPTLKSKKNIKTLKPKNLKTFPKRLRFSSPKWRWWW